MWRFALFLILGISFWTGPIAQGQADDKFRHTRPPAVSVMTQNLYVGANLNSLFGTTIENIPTVTGKILEEILLSDFIGRAQAIADLIARHRPDLIGLQEVTTIRTQSPGDFFSESPEPAQYVEIDYLDVLLTALGDEYKVAASNTNSDIELPMLAGVENDTALLDDVRLTDSDVILVRNDVAISNATSHSYAVNLEVPFQKDENSDEETTLTIKRGFSAVDAQVRGRTYRVVNTHLEGLAAGPNPIPEIQALQALELIEELQYEDLPIILLGDFNSSPQDPVTFQPLLILPPYKQFRLAGYTDVWLRDPFARRDPGFTCCQSDRLENENSELDERIDHIFVRNPLKLVPISITGRVFATILGNQPEDKTDSGLWPSDHAAMAAMLRIPQLNYYTKHWSSGRLAQ